MISKVAIDSALTAHSLWEKRLLEAIEKGESEFKVVEVKKDNMCQFGQWLYNLPDVDKKTIEFENIKTLHAEFHKTAASILELGLSGKKDDALKRIEHGGDYG
jgi:Chemoreceptor zinc-binding domain